MIGKVSQQYMNELYQTIRLNKSINFFLKHYEHEGIKKNQPPSASVIELHQDIKQAIINFTREFNSSYIIVKDLQSQTAKKILNFIHHLIHNQNNVKKITLKSTTYLQIDAYLLI